MSNFCKGLHRYFKMPPTTTCGKIGIIIQIYHSLYCIAIKCVNVIDCAKPLLIKIITLHFVKYFANLHQKTIKITRNCRTTFSPTLLHLFKNMCCFFVSILSRTQLSLILGLLSLSTNMKTPRPNCVQGWILFMSMALILATKQHPSGGKSSKRETF